MTESLKCRDMLRVRLLFFFFKFPLFMKKNPKCEGTSTDICKPIKDKMNHGEKERKGNMK